MVGLKRRSSIFISAVFLFAVIYSDHPRGSGELRDIRLQGFLPMTGVGWPAGGACLPATLMAVRHVNGRAGLLDGYSVTYSWADSRCEAGQATFQMFQSLSKPPVKNMLLGAGCSVATMPTAQVSHLFNLTQISYGSTSPALSDRSRFPNYYQIDIPDHAINPAKIAIMREFGWRKVATINQAVEYHSLVIDDFVRSVDILDDITIITQELFQDDPTRRVENLKTRDARIIFVQMYGDKARMFLCAAYKLGLYGPNIVLFFNNWYSYDFWKPRNEVTCTEEEMDQAMEGAFIMGSFIQNPRSERGIAGLTVSEFDELYKQEETYDPVNDKHYLCAAWSYDCVWLAALALNCTETYLRSTGHSKYLDEFTYQDSDMNDVILSCMNNISLVGVSGRIFYGGNSAPVNKNIKIERVQNSKRVTVGSYIMDEEEKRFEWIKDALQWKDNQVPRDSTYIKYEEISIPTWLYITLTSCAGVGLLMVFGCLVFNIVYRHTRIVQMSSPHINNTLLLGCILIYSATFMSTAVSKSSILCKAKTFCFSIGLTIAVGTYFFKTLRVYNMFIKKKETGYFGSKWRTRRVRTLQRSITDLDPEKFQKVNKPITDYEVIGMVCILTAIIFILLVIWEAVSPQILLTKELISEIFLTADDAEVRPFIHVCHSKNGVYFSWTLYIVEGIILVFGAFLAWETRNVKLQTQSDTHEIGVCLYNTLVLGAFGLTVSLLLEDSVAVVYALTSGCVVIGTTLNLGIVFVPKMNACRQGLSSVQPIEENIMGGVNTDMSVATTSVPNYRLRKQGQEKETVTECSLSKTGSA